VHLRWQDDFVADLCELRAYIAQDSPQASAQVAQRIRQAVALLCKQPAMGRPGRVLDTWELVISGTPYIVAYCVQEKVVTILRILHDSRRWPKQFS
jgi:toxin ParE1/3/4